jgi:hypothetical protein
MVALGVEQVEVEMLAVSCLFWEPSVCFVKGIMYWYSVGSAGGGFNGGFSGGAGASGSAGGNFSIHLNDDINFW